MLENRKIKLLICIMYKLHNSYFVLFGNFVIWGFLDFYINLLMEQKINGHMFKLVWHFQAAPRRTIKSRDK